MGDIPFGKQVESLSSLVEYHSSRSASVQASCRNLLRLLQNEEAHNFIFGIGEFSPLSALRDSNLCRSAAACTIQQMEFEAPCYSLCRTTVFSSSYLFVTVFRGVGYSLGVLIGHQKVRAFKDLHCTEEDKSADARRLTDSDRTAVMRFVKDEQDGTISVFNDDGRFLHVEIHRAESTICCRLTAFTFDRHGLMKALRKIPTEDDLIRCLHAYEDADMLRKCPLCLASPLLPCQCSLPSMIDDASLISGPRDDSISSTGMPLFLGDFQGVSRSQRFASGVLLERKALGSVRKIRPVTNWSTMTSLVNRGITCCVDELTLDPWAGVLPAAEESQTNDALLLIDFDVDPTCADDRRETEIALKEKIRAERNRAFARRSNLRKKMENDARKSELKRLRNLEAQLVAKERRLRQENLIMRSLLQA